MDWTGVWQLKNFPVPSTILFSRWGKEEKVAPRRPWAGIGEAAWTFWIFFFLLQMGNQWRTQSRLFQGNCKRGRRDVYLEPWLLHKWWQWRRRWEPITLIRRWEPITLIASQVMTMKEKMTEYCFISSSGFYHYSVETLSSSQFPWGQMRWRLSLLW